MTDTNAGSDLSQIAKFKAAVRDLETDEDETRFREDVGKPVKHMPVGQTKGDSQ